jgi:hypothetical protein
MRYREHEHRHFGADGYSALFDKHGGYVKRSTEWFFIYIHTFLHYTYSDD